MTKSPHLSHKAATRAAARVLRSADIYDWLMNQGYFPESYVLPPCFAVGQRPPRKRIYPINRDGREYRVPRRDLATVHFPKSEMTDRRFGIIDPRIYSDIAFDIARNWKKLVDRMVPNDSKIVSYSFPIPLDTRKHGRLGVLRSGRMIYEFLGMVDRDMTSVAYRYSYLVKTDIKNFYPSIYTHALAWVLHGKKKARAELHNYKLLGNRLDKLFQNANDGCTNGIPIGPAVSDVAAELITAFVDRRLSKSLSKHGIDCAAFRFKDDYRFLVKSESDGRAIVKHLQSALRELNLELNEGKTAISPLPDGLFREWSSMYWTVHPRRRSHYSWKDFRELYLAVLRIDRVCPGTGVIDRFLADVVTRSGRLKVTVVRGNLSRVLSMLLMLGGRRVKAFPKVVAIIEAVIRSSFGATHRVEITEYLEAYLAELASDEERNKYLIAWISYFFVSNGLKKSMKFKPVFKDAITRSVFQNRRAIFKDCPEFGIFIGCRASSRKVTMLRHLEVFLPPPDLLPP